MHQHTGHAEMTPRHMRQHTGHAEATPCRMHQNARHTEVASHRMHQHARRSFRRRIRTLFLPTGRHGRTTPTATRIWSHMQEEALDGAHLIRPVAHIKTPYPVKFGVPRQPGLVDALEGVVYFEPEFRDADAVRGLETFDYVWLIWDFSQNHRGGKWTPTVRPPRLGGTRRMGVFATRSSFRPNDLALSCVKLARVELDEEYPDGSWGPALHVIGADMMDGSPIYDIKPYLPFSDSKPKAGHGWVEADEWHELEVDFAPELLAQLPAHLHKGAFQVLAQDPRPAHARVTSQGRDFWVTLENYDIHFAVEDTQLTVTRVVELTDEEMQRLRETGTIH